MFVGMAIVSAVGMMLDPTTPPGNRVILAVGFSSFWLVMASMSGYLIAACRREVWDVDRFRIVCRGLFRRMTMHLDAVLEAKWVCNAQGKITLKTRDQTLRISLETFEREDRLWLIRLVRDRIPEDRQTGWERFCGALAVPLTKPAADVVRPLKANEVRLSRARFDLYFGFLLACAVLIAVFALDHLEAHRRLAAPLAAVLSWLLIRFQIPKKGMIAPRMSFDWRRDRWFLALLVWSGVPLTLLFLHRGRESLELSALLIVEAIGWFAGFLLIAWRIDRIQAAERLARQQRAAMEWQDKMASRNVT
ncbi:hypothetical protein Pan44_03210 [Caulifigura coniformis]|uniref:Uncharacterized protein n=2 Tax=Caulifigura coniformis TaxID=2527983 RepID=A0A517S877_9PLAN|nr:hypothetical protein Pan44_03210 [Caulifigura coniformis]